MSRPDLQVQCTRCRNKHMESQRAAVRTRSIGKVAMFDHVCPRCGCKSFYDITPAFAWCWASGLIEIGKCAPECNEDGSGAILIAQGPMAFLTGVLGVVARHGQGASTGCLLVPGVPEAGNQKDAGDALAAWLLQCAKRNGRRGSNGVTFWQEQAHAG